MARHESAVSRNPDKHRKCHERRHRRPACSALTPPCWVPVGLTSKENNNIRGRATRAEPAFPPSTWGVYSWRLVWVDNVHLRPLHLISTSGKPERISGRKGRKMTPVFSCFSLALALIANSAARIIHADILKAAMCWRLRQAANNSCCIPSVYWTSGAIVTTWHGFIPLTPVRLDGVDLTSSRPIEKTNLWAFQSGVPWLS